MRVSLFGLFLRCTSLMGPWPKRIQSILLISALLGFPVLWWLCYTRSYILHLCSNPPVFCTWHLCSSWLATWLSYSYSPGEFHWLPWILMSRSWSVWISPVTDQSGAAVAWTPSWPFRAPSFQAPVYLSSFLSVNSWVLLYSFTLVHFHVFPHLRICDIIFL